MIVNHKQMKVAFMDGQLSPYSQGLLLYVIEFLPFNEGKKAEGKMGDLQRALKAVAWLNSNAPGWDTRSGPPSAAS